MADGVTVGAAAVGSPTTSEPAHRRLGRPGPIHVSCRKRCLHRTSSTLLIHSVRLEDKLAFIAGFAKLVREETRMRFMRIVKELTDVDTERLTPIDYDREMALLALRHRDSHEWESCEVTQIIGDTNRDRGELAIVLLRDAIGIVLSSLPLRRPIGYVRAQNIRKLFWENPA